MVQHENAHARIVPFTRVKKDLKKYRKFNINRNRDGSVRKINEKVYIDFIYLDERIRECSGLSWNEQNAKVIREQLDKIIVAIKSGTFRFAEVFPSSINKEHFAEKERLFFGLQKKTSEVKVGEYITCWFDRLRGSGRVTGRTLSGYKSYVNNYLQPFFKDLKFSDINKIACDRFIAWVRDQKLRNKEISNNTINKIFVPLKLICKDAAVEYEWGCTYNPFFAFKKLKEVDSYEKIYPFSLDEQQQILANIPDHWKQYVAFSFCCGLRHGEQTGIKPEDINWEKKILRIQRAITRDEAGNIIEGTTKNKYSIRTIKLTTGMFKILMIQKAIHEKLQSEYFFCSDEGKLIDINNLRHRVWAPAIKKAGITYRDMKQTRHSFATTALSKGVNPLLISRIMGHRNTEMIIKVYGKYIDNNTNESEMEFLDNIFQ